MQRTSIDLAGLRQEALVVWGGEDRVIPVSYADLADAAIPAAQRVIIPDAGHAPQIEAADVFAEVVQRFISET